MSTLPRTADIVIVGAGVMGTSIAFQLARRGAGRVLVLDKAAVGQGMSGRSSALVRMHYSYPGEVRLALRSLAMFRGWSEITGRPGDFRETGFVYIVPGAERERLERNVAMQRALGVDARVVTGADLREMEPDWCTDDVEVAAYEPGSGYGDGASVAGDFLAAAREAGAAYCSGTRVTAFRVDGGRVRGVETEHGHVDAPVVVAATGPWSGPLLRAAGFAPPIETEYHEVAILKNPPSLRGAGLACIDGILQLYSRPEGRDMTLVGSFYGPRGKDPDAFPQQAGEESLAEMASGIARRIPKLGDAGLAHGITGLYDTSPDHRPLLGEVPGVRGLHLVAGFSGMGFKISPAVGEAMAEWILDGRATHVDLHPFRPGRFLEGQPIRGEHEYEDE